MAKQSMIEREKKRLKLVRDFKQRRENLILDLNKGNNFSEKQKIRKNLEKLPRNSSPIRLRNRCWRTGRSRGIYRDFGLCRHMIREMAHTGLLPGLRKSSW
ncbi:unnamed protein product [Dictyota dichotoma]